jgi:exosortase
MGMRQWILMGTLALVFIPAIRSLAEVWSSLEYYSHGFLVPVVALWIGWDRAARLGSPGADARGLLIIGASLALYGIGLGMGSATGMGLGAVLAATGVVWHFWGSAGVKRLAFPLGLLLFVVPVPPVILTPIVLQLQFFVSTMAVEILQLAGFTVLREGNVVELAGGPLFVAEACSGITSIVTLLPLAAVLAYFTERRSAARVGLVLAVVPIAMLGNLVRVIATVAAAEVFGIDKATGSWLHESAGLITFTLECGLLIGLGSLVGSVLACDGVQRVQAA